mmetsp:Transcript_8158/g.24565  ORF Transcript_8158/g.24565 Transcript_8158/m.24565 type:complete len:485 (-) Transcript_8158:208-1662(-)
MSKNSMSGFVVWLGHDCGARRQRPLRCAEKRDGHEKVAKAAEAAGKFGEKIGIVQLGRHARTRTHKAFTGWETMKERPDSGGADKAKSAAAVVVKSTGGVLWSVWKRTGGPLFRKVYAKTSDEASAAIALGLVLAIILLPTAINVPSLPIPNAPEVSVSDSKADKKLASQAKDLTSSVKRVFGRRKSLIAGGSLDGSTLSVKVDPGFNSLDEQTRRSLALASYESVKDKKVGVVLFQLKDTGDTIARVDEGTVVYSAEIKLKEKGESLRATLGQQRDLVVQEQNANSALMKEQDKIREQIASTEQEAKVALETASQASRSAEEEVEALDAAVANTPDRGVLVSNIKDAEKRMETAKSSLMGLGTELYRAKETEKSSQAEARGLSGTVEQEKKEIAKINEEFSSKLASVKERAEKDVETAASSTAKELDAQLVSQREALKQLQQRYDKLVADRDSQLRAVQAEFESQTASLQAETDKQLAELGAN